MFDLRNHKNKGFSLIEMLVVITIFLLLTSVIVFNYGKFNSDIFLTNIAYEVALSIREAQSYSLSVKGFGTGEQQTFDKSYGIQFFTNSGADDDKKKNFIFFVDSNNNHVCDGGDDDVCNTGSQICTMDECLSINSLARGVMVKKICASSDINSDISFRTVKGQLRCSLGAEQVDANLFISFKRPDPDATILAGDDGDYDFYKKVAILLEDPSGSRRFVTVNGLGQINVDFLNN